MKERERERELVRMCSALLLKETISLITYQIGLLALFGIPAINLEVFDALLLRRRCALGFQRGIRCQAANQCRTTTSTSGLGGGGG